MPNQHPHQYAAQHQQHQPVPPHQQPPPNAYQSSPTAPGWTPYQPSPFSPAGPYVHAPLFSPTGAPPYGAGLFGMNGGPGAASSPNAANATSGGGGLSAEVQIAAAAVAAAEAAAQAAAENAAGGGVGVPAMPHNVTLESMHHAMTDYANEQAHMREELRVRSGAVAAGLVGGGGSGLAELQMSVDETFEERERRSNAARILESNEMLIWWSSARNESIPQTRLHFEKVVAGIESDESDKEWENSNEELREAEARGSPKIKARTAAERRSKGGSARKSSRRRSGSASRKGGGKGEGGGSGTAGAA